MYVIVFISLSPSLVISTPPPIALILHHSHMHVMCAYLTFATSSRWFGCLGWFGGPAFDSFVHIDLPGTSGAMLVLGG